MLHGYHSARERDEATEKGRVEQGGAWGFWGRGVEVGTAMSSYSGVTAFLHNHTLFNLCLNHHPFLLEPKLDVLSLCSQIWKTPFKYLFKLHSCYCRGILTLWIKEAPKDMVEISLKKLLACFSLGLCWQNVYHVDGNDDEQILDGSVMMMTIKRFPSVTRHLALTPQ